MNLTSCSQKYYQVKVHQLLRLKMGLRHTYYVIALRVIPSSNYSEWRHQFRKDFIFIFIKDCFIFFFRKGCCERYKTTDKQKKSLCMGAYVVHNEYNSFLYSKCIKYNCRYFSYSNSFIPRVNTVSTWLLIHNFLVIISITSPQPKYVIKLFLKTQRLFL